MPRDSIDTIIDSVFEFAGGFVAGSIYGAILPFNHHIRLDGEFSAILGLLQGIGIYCKGNRPDRPETEPKVSVGEASTHLLPVATGAIAGATAVRYIKSLFPIEQ